MNLDVVELLFGAGLAGGIANAVAGGATLITFPAMLAAGLPPVIANASNAVAVTPGHLVPALIGLATLVFACGRVIQDWVARAFGHHGGDHTVARAVLLAPTAVYGGYFGAG